LRELADISALLPSESGASEVGLGQRCDPPGRHRTGESLQPSVRGAARRERYLLLQDDLDKGLEAWNAVPEGRCPVARYHSGEMRIPARELGNAFGERLGRQLKRHVNLTS